VEQVPFVIPTLNEERSIGKVIDGVPVADFLQNGLKMAAIRGTSHDALRYIKRSLAKLLSAHRLGNWN
jgi:hypothetical protein